MNEYEEKYPIFAIISKMKIQAEMESENFIRACSLDEESANVVLFTEDKLHDLVNSIFYVDDTFQLVPFCVILTSYQNTTLFTKTTGNCHILLFSKSSQHLCQDWNCSYKGTQHMGRKPWDSPWHKKPKGQCLFSAKFTLKETSRTRATSCTRQSDQSPSL